MAVTFGIFPSDGAHADIVPSGNEDEKGVRRLRY